MNEHKSSYIAYLLSGSVARRSAPLPSPPGRASTY